MARRSNLPSTSARIFSRKPSRTSRILSALLLSLSLLVTLAGLGTAIYLERTRDSSATPPSPSLAADAPGAAAGSAPILSAAVTASEPHDPLAASAAVPSLDSPERHGSTVSPSPSTVAPPTQTALLEAPPSADRPSSTDSTSAATEETTPPGAPYWVEYGVYTGARAAKRLQQALADHGLDTVVVPTHAPDGRPLLRVRSTLMLDRAAARAAAENAGQALKVSTLIHRGAVSPRQSPARTATPNANRPDYWVQFGAFPYHRQALRLQERLARGGIETAVSTMLGASGRTLYRVRSLALPDRHSAVAVAERAREAGDGNFLVGQSAARPAPGAERKRTEDGSAGQSARYSAAGSLPFPAR